MPSRSAPLPANVFLFWRVVANNGCGASAPSTTFRFSTTTPPPAAILLVDDDNNAPDVRSFYANAITASGLTFDVFNTNTFWFSAKSLDRDFDLGWYYVEKTVDGRRAVQVEHLVGELTAHLSTNFLQIRRSGKQTRFLPMKSPDDLRAAIEEITDMYAD